MSKIAKVPEIMQMESVECGAVSLAMICAYYKKWIPFEKLRKDCGVSRDGSNAKNMFCAAKSYGLDCKAYSYDCKKLPDLPVPSIIFWKYNHFVVLKGFNKKYAFINDPGQGSVKVPINDFNKCYSDLVMIFKPNKNFVPEGKPYSIWGFIKKQIKGFQIPFVIIAAMLLVISVTSLLIPMFGQFFIDSILSENYYPNEYYLFIFSMLIVILLQFIASSINTKYLTKINAKICMISNSIFLWHVIRLPIEFFSQRNTVDIINRQMSNDLVSESITMKTTLFILNILMVTLFLTTMFIYNLSLGFVVFLSVAINLIVLAYNSRKTINAFSSQNLQAGRLPGLMISGIQMIETIKTTGSENNFFGKWSEVFEMSSDSELFFNSKNQVYTVVLNLIRHVTNITVLFMGAYQIMKGGFSVGLLLTFQGFLNQFMTPLNQIQEFRKDVPNLKRNIRRIQDVLKYEPDIAFKEKLPNLKLEKLSGKIELKNITFGYSNLENPIIKDLNLSIKKGEKIAIVGVSGSGKSTIAKLIAGLHKPWEGRILFDDIPQEEIPRRVKNGSVSIVSQDIILFEDSIKDNINMWDKNVSSKNTINAAKDACIHGEILLRPKGYSYIVMEQGKNFSTGEQQRLEIARSLAINPSIIIMDEATSCLDFRTESDIINSVNSRGITVILISNRLSTIKNCDEIVVLDKGTIVQRGSHSDLSKQDGLYKRLVNTE